MLLQGVICGTNTHSTKSRQAEDDKVLQQWKSKKQKRTIAADKESTQTPAESTTPTAEKQRNNTPINLTDNINIGQSGLLDVPHIRGLTSSNPFFADGIPEHLQCPPDLIGKYYHEIPPDSAADSAAKMQAISLEVMEKYNPNRRIADIWNQFIAAEKFYHDNSPVEGRKLSTSQGRADWTVQTFLDFPETVQISMGDSDMFNSMWMVELGISNANWNLWKLPDGREFRTRTGYRYEFTYTKDPDNPLSPSSTRSFSHSNPETATLIKVNLNETSDEELKRLSGWNFNINPYTTGAFSVEGNNK